MNLFLNVFEVNFFILGNILFSGFNFVLYYRVNSAFFWLVLLWCIFFHHCFYLIDVFFKKILFIYFRERVRRGRGRGKRREKILGRLCAEHRAWCGAWSHNHKIRTWAKIKSRMLSWLSHQRAPNLLVSFYLKCVSYKKHIIGYCFSLQSDKICL